MRSFVDRLQGDRLPPPLRVALAERTGQNDPYLYHKLQLLNSVESAQTPYQVDRYQTEILRKDDPQKGDKRLQLEYTLTEQIRHFKESKKFERDRQERTQRIGQIEAMLDNFNKERKRSNPNPEARLADGETPATVRTDQNSSICKEGTVDLKRKQFVKNFALEKERQRKQAGSKGLIKVSSASALPPQAPA